MGAEAECALALLPAGKAAAGRECGANSARQKGGGMTSAHERTGENQLKLLKRAGRRRKERQEMPDGVQEGIGLRSLRGLLLLTEQGTEHVQPQPQPSAQLIKRLQGKGQSQGLDGRLERSAGEQLAEQLPEPGGGDTVAGQHVGKEKGKSSSTAAALATVRTIHSLASELLAGRVGGVVPVKEAVAV